MYRFLYLTLATIFAVLFSLIVVPALVESGDIVGAMAAGFVNPFASGYALDAILCWCVLAVWVIQEARERGIRYGWVALLLGVAPGVATGFAIYLVLRESQLNRTEHERGRA